MVRHFADPKERPGTLCTPQAVQPVQVEEMLCVHNPQQALEVTDMHRHLQAVQPAHEEQQVEEEDDASDARSGADDDQAGAATAMLPKRTSPTNRAPTSGDNAV